MKKGNVILFLFTIVGIFIPAIILIVHYKYSCTQIVNDILIAILTGCVIAVPNIILLLHQNRIEKNRIKYEIISEFAKHYAHIDSKYFYTAEIGTLSYEVEYLDSLTDRLSYLITDYYVSSREKRKIDDFNVSCVKLRKNINNLKRDRDSINSKTLDNRINMCVSRAKAINNYLDHKKEIDQ